MKTVLDHVAEAIDSGDLKVYPIVELVAYLLKSSKSHARKLIESGAVDVNGFKTKDKDWLCVAGDSIRIGKGKFYTI
jgi:RNA-binding protein YlmH